MKPRIYPICMTSRTRPIFSALAVWILLLWSGCTCRAQNVALNKPVTIVSGADTVIQTNPAPVLGVITDGQFLGETTPYLSGAAASGAMHWLTSVPGGTVFELQLGGLHTLNGIIVQADDNDALSISYLAADNTYRPLYYVAYASVGFGFRTRPNADQTTWAELAPVTTSTIRVTNTSGDGYFGISELQLRGVPGNGSGVDANLIGHWVADDLPLGNSGDWTSRVNGVVARVDRGSPQVSAGPGFNGHRYVTLNPSNPEDAANADTFYVPAGSAAHPAAQFSITVVFRMPATASGSGSTVAGEWHENTGLVGMEVAGAPNPPDWILGIDGANHLSGAGVRGTTAVNSGRVIIATVSYTGNDQFLFVNGVLEGQYAMGRTSSLTTSPYAIGANRASDSRGGSGFPERFFSGDIAEIRIHSAVVNAQGEFQALQARYLPTPEIANFGIINGTPRISFTTMAGGDYRVEWNSTLTETAWTTVTGAEDIQGTGGIIHVNDPDVTAGSLPRRFYRVLLAY